MQAQQTWAARTFQGLAVVLGLLQYEAAALGSDAVEEMLDELEIDAPPEGIVAPEAFSGSTAAGADDMVGYLESMDSLVDLEMATITELLDAARTAEQAAIAARPKVTGYVRHVIAPCCSRCAILAGRVYRYSEGFQRHPNCKCFHTPVTGDVADELIQDPMELFKSGAIHDLTVAEDEAIKMGADIADVINIRRKSAGLKVAGRVLERGNRLTVEGILHLATDRDEAIDLLTRTGYIR